MAQTKLSEMVMMSLTNLQAEILTLKDFIQEEYFDKKNLNEVEKNALIASYNKSRIEYQKMILAQLRANYDEDLGSVDDLIKGL